MVIDCSAYKKNGAIVSDFTENGQTRVLEEWAQPSRVTMSQSTGATGHQRNCQVFSVPRVVASSLNHQLGWEHSNLPQMF